MHMIIIIIINIIILGIDFFVEKYYKEMFIFSINKDELTLDPLRIPIMLFKDNELYKYR